MPYEIRRAPQARRDIRDFFHHLKTEAGEKIARKYLEELDNDLLELIANNPNSFNWFHETGAPYRAKVFKLARTRYWIVYVVDDERQIVEFLRFWNTAREQDTHGL